MALDPEELKKRRLQRQIRERQRKAKRRKLLLRLVFAAVVLIGCGLLIFFTSRNQTKPEPFSTQPQESQTGTESATAQTEETEQPKSKTTEVRLTFAGDLNVTDRVVASGGSNYDYTNTFQDVLPALAEADLTVLNFEGNLLGSPYGSSSASAPQQLVEALRRTGVDMLQLANSYSIHNGVSGLQNTINAVYAAGLEPLGVYTDRAAFQAAKGYTIRRVQGIDIAFVAFTKGMDGMTLPGGSEDCVNVLYTDYDSTYQTVDREGITKILQNVEKAKPDLTVALLHWGSEFNDTISESQEKIVSLMKENGVDVIVGTHPHYVQKVDFDQEAGTLIAYSLGDFCGNADRAGSEYSIALNLEITRDNQKNITKVTGWDYTPLFTVSEPERPLRVVRLQEAIREYEIAYLDRVNKDTYEDMVYAMGRIEARVAGQ